MMRRIIQSLVVALATYFVITFLALQFLNITRYSNISSVDDFTITFNYDLFEVEDIGPKILLIVKLLAIFVFVWMICKDIGIQKAKSAYEKSSYNKLLKTYQRKRGTIRVQYDDAGKITRNTLECYYDHVMLPITKLQNKICNLYHLPENKKWNTIHNYKNLDGSIRHNTSGIPVVAYRKYFLFGKYNRINYISDVVHALFVGMSGKGKSQTFVLPMIQSNIDAGESMFVHDPKKELLSTMRQKLERENYKIIVIDFVSPEESEGWNPLYFAWDRWKKAVNKTVTKDYHDADLSEAIELILDISKIISYQEDANNPIWHEGAGDMIAAGAFFAMEEGKEEDINFTTINYLYQLGSVNDVLFKYMDKYRTPEDQSVLKLDTYRSAEGITRAGLKATFKNKISLLTATPAIQKLLAANTWEFDEIFDQKTAIFMVKNSIKI